MIMKKMLLIIGFVFTFSVGFAQAEKGESAFVAKTGLGTNPSRFTVGGSWRYAIWDNFRFAGDLNYLFPKGRIQSLNVDANFQYLIPIDVSDSEMYAYPSVGASMLNERFMGTKIGGRVVESAFGSTAWGFNLGGGYEYYMTDAVFANTELKYIFGDVDSFWWTIGIGVRF